MVVLHGSMKGRLRAVRLKGVAQLVFWSSDSYRGFRCSQFYNIDYKLKYIDSVMVCCDAVTYICWI